MSPNAPAPGESGPLFEQTDERSSRADWRSTTIAAILLTLVAGTWLIVSPAVIRYDRPANPILWGVLIVLLSLLRLFGPTSSRTLALTTAAAGVLAVASAFLADETAGPTGNLAVTGAAVTVLAIIGLGAREESPRRSRG